ncbi:MAG: ECF transporter S component [archaeon]|nr:MAG: ECF transporter S component [archaeon]
MGAQLSESQRRSNSVTVAGAAVFTAFVAAATALFAVNLPLGYFNVGEIMVYTSALLMGPYVGFFAGGFGSMIADLATGYPQYAAGTFVIKGAEGFIVGFLSTRVFSRLSRTEWRATTIATGVIVSVLLGYVGVTYLSGSFSIALGGTLYVPWFLGGNWSVPAYQVDLDVPAYFWAGLAALVLAVLTVVATRSAGGTGKMALAVLVGGAEMVAGYFLYETYALQLGSYPPTEVPFNIAQALVGLIVAVPLVRSAKKVAGRRGARPRGSVP